MEQLERPSSLVWDERQLWFQDLQQQHQKAGVRKLSEQAVALLIDLEAVFCVGAWASVVLLAGVIVESQFEASGEFSKLPAKDWEWLRRGRNRLAHERAGKPSLTVEDQWQKRDIWEGKARKAVRLMFQALYGQAA